jgi:putative ABC transport system permease protein
MLETTLLGAIGAAIGIAVGTTLAVVVSAIGIPMPPPPNSESGFIATIRLVPMVMAGSFVLGFVASVSAAFIPARRAARFTLAEALRRAV